MRFLFIRTDLDWIKIIRPGWDSSPQT